MTPSCMIRGARIIDGTGAPWFTGDVALAGGRIAAVGPSLPDGGGLSVDAAGSYLAPGFIDAHAHDDMVFLKQPDRAEKVAQGVTTVVVGNCSFSLYPKRPASEASLLNHFSGLLGPTAADDTFAEFADYRHRLEGQGIAINLMSLVGHGALRLAVMGPTGRAATGAELDDMAELLDRQLASGATGLSLGLVYPPSAFADSAELVRLAKVVAGRGKLLTAHVRSYEQHLLDALDEFIGLLVESGARGLVSHLQSAGKPNWGRLPLALVRLDEARGRGIDVSFDMYPYPAGSTSLLQLLPPATLEGGIEALSERLRDPGFLAGLRRYVEGGEPDAGGAISKVVLIGWQNVLISGVAHESLKAMEGKSVLDAAAAEGMAPFDLMVRLIIEDGGQTSVVLFQLDEADLRAAFTHPLHMVGSDGLPRPGSRPHPRAFGTFPRVAGTLVRKLAWLQLEDAIRRMTSAPAQRFGLQDRGIVRPGMVADLVLFTPEIEDRASFDRPTDLPVGIRSVWVSGEMVFEEGTATGRRPGRVLA